VIIFIPNAHVLNDISGYIPEHKVSGLVQGVTLAQRQMLVQRPERGIGEGLCYVKPWFYAQDSVPAPI
jgi:hypothetical protein